MEMMGPFLYRFSTQWIAQNTIINERDYYS